jgi:nitroreductase
MATIATDAGIQPTPSLTADEVLSTTRNVRKRLDLTRPVPRELIEECLRISYQAPIASNGFYPHYLVVTDPAKRAALAPIYKRAWDTYVTLPVAAPNLHFEDPLHEAQQPRVTASATYLAEHFAEVPALVIPCISPRPQGQPTWVESAIWGSVMPQAWSVMLAARTRGLGVAWTCLHLMFEEEAAGILGIPYADVLQAGLLAMAYSQGTDFKPAYREPLERFLHWDTW